MKRWSVVLSTAALALIVGWCWLYQAYQGVTRETLSAAHLDLYPGIRSTLDAFEKSRQAKVIGRIRTFSERVAYLRAVALAHIGDEQAASALFTQLATAAQTDLAERALYNKAHYSVRTGALEEARDQYRKALVMNPDDLQAKINLELLLVRMKEEQAAAKQQGDKQGPPQPMNDYWTREENLQDGPSSASKRIWK